MPAKNVQPPAFSRCLHIFEGFALQPGQIYYVSRLNWPGGLLATRLGQLRLESRYQRMVRLTVESVASRNPYYLGPDSKMLRGMRPYLLILC